MWGIRENFFIKEIEKAYISEGKLLNPTLKDWLLWNPEETGIFGIFANQEMLKYSDNIDRTIKEIGELLLKRLFKRAEALKLYCNFFKTYSYAKNNLFPSGKITNLDLIMFHCPLLICVFSWLARIAEEESKMHFNLFGSSGLSMVINYVTMQLYDNLTPITDPIINFLKSGEKDIKSNLCSMSELSRSMQFIRNYAPSEDLNKLLFIPKR